MNNKNNNDNENNKKQINDISFLKKPIKIIKRKKSKIAIKKIYKVFNKIQYNNMYTKNSDREKYVSVSSIFDSQKKKKQK